MNSPTNRADAHRSLHWIDDELESLDQQHLRRRARVRQSPHVAGMVQLDDTTYIDFSSNDYLGLSADSRLVDAAHRCIAQAGFGSGASPLISGYGVWHRELERQLAEFKQTEAALVFGSGYAANVATITALVGPGDIIYSDELNHASIIDGCRLSGAKITVYRHGDVEHLQHLSASRRDYRRALMVTDSLFSMDGDLAPLNELVALAERIDAILMVDEAHATGVFGAGGRGVVESCGLEGHVPVVVGTLSKALGASGGFLTGSASLIEWVRNKGRPYIYSTAMPELIAAVALAALEAIRSAPSRGRMVLRTSDVLRDRLRAMGIDCGSSRSQIIPLFVGDPERALTIGQRLADAGCFVPVIRPPTVPPGTSRLRISLTAAHTDSQLMRLLHALEAAW